MLMLVPDTYPLGSQQQPCARIGLDQLGLKGPDEGITPT